MFKKISALGLGAFAASVAAHGYIPGFVTDGKWNQGFLLDYYYQKVNTGSFPNIAAWYSENLDSGFVAPDAFQTSDINCHKNSAPGVLSGTVAAGGTVTFQWTTWPHNLGPVLTYVARCSGECSAADKNSLRWVKIEAVGINYATQVWASQTLMNNNNTWTTRVPSTLAPGNYVFRHEMIALHGAGSANGAQAYPFCFNIKITGSGTDNPAGTLGKDLYKSNDPGILMNPYTSLTTYQMPGPSLYTGGGGGTPSTTTARTTSSTLTTTVRSSSTTTRSSASPTTSTGVCSPLYGQCGGSGYTGPTCCLVGTCKYSNDFYSQCLN